MERKESHANRSVSPIQVLPLQLLISFRMSDISYKMLVWLTIFRITLIMPQKPDHNL